jgi:hypothetical protein
MLKKCLSLLLVGLLIQITGLAALAKSGPEKEAQRIEKIRAAILSLGVGPDARIRVKLKDDSKLEGSIKEVADDHFVITDARTGTDTSVAYPQVKTAQGQNLSKGAKIAIGVGVAVGIVILTLFLIWHGHLSPGHG